MRWRRWLLGEHAVRWLSCLRDYMVGVIYNDNIAALSIATGRSGSWRTRHLRIRANALTEAVEKKEWMLWHLDGGYLGGGWAHQSVGRNLA